MLGSVNNLSSGYGISVTGGVKLFFSGGSTTNVDFGSSGLNTIDTALLGNWEIVDVKQSLVSAMVDPGAWPSGETITDIAFWVIVQSGQSLTQAYITTTVGSGGWIDIIRM